MNQFSSLVTVKPGTDWTPHERDEVAELIHYYGALNRTVAMETNLLHAPHLARITVDGILVGVGAIKSPQASYKTRVSDEAEVDLSGYLYEFGYLTVYQPCRNRGIGTAITAKLLDGFTEPMYAVAEEKSWAEKILLAQGFTQVGADMPRAGFAVLRVLTRG